MQKRNLKIVNHQLRGSVPANIKWGFGQGFICHSDQFWLLRYHLAAYMQASVFIAGAAVLVLITLPSYHLPQSIPANDRSPSVGTRERGEGGPREERRDGAQRRGRGRCFSKCGLVFVCMFAWLTKVYMNIRLDYLLMWTKVNCQTANAFVQSINSGLYLYKSHNILVK